MRFKKERIILDLSKKKKYRLNSRLDDRDIRKGIILRSRERDQVARKYI